MHYRGDDVLEHGPVRYPPAVADQRMRRVKLRALVAEQGGELAPDGFQQA